MNDDRAISDADDEPADGGALDEHDDAVIAADDTGMLSGERLITMAEIEHGLEGK